MWMSSAHTGTVALACGSGAILAIAYTLSPMTVWFAAAVLLIFAHAGRGVEGRERRWLLGLLSAGVAARVLVLTGFFLFTSRADGSFPVLLPDEGYIAHRSMWLRNIALGTPIAPSDFIDTFNPFAESGILYVLAYLQLVVGPAPYGVRLLGVMLYVSAAVIGYRMVRPTFGAAASLIGLAVMLFMPSAFVWSLSTLKEPPYYFLSAVALASAVAAVRASSFMARIVAIAACVGAVAAVETVRTTAAIVIGGGIGVGLAFALLMRKPAVRAAVLVLSLVLGGYALTDARVQARATQFLHKTVVMHIGHVKTPGRAYRLLDPEFYTRQDRVDINYGEAARTMEGDDIARYLIRAALSFLLVPLPWQVSSWPAVAYLPQQVIWCVLVLFAATGALAGLRRDRFTTLFLLCTLLIAAGAVVLTSGNIGTFVRHRDMTLAPVAWLSGLGVVAAVRYAFAWGGSRKAERV